jgi:hypothetical protein
MDIEKQTAFHEAGHAVTDLVLGHAPDFSSIIKKGDTLGREEQMDGDEFSVEGMEDLVISLYAGAAAEKKITNDLKSVMGGANSDYKKAEEYLRSLRSTKEELEQRADELIRKHWSLVKRIAKELIEYGELEWGELDFLFNIYRGEETEQDLALYRAKALQMGAFDHLKGRRK